MALTTYALWVGATYLLEGLPRMPPRPEAAELRALSPPLWRSAEPAPVHRLDPLTDGDLRRLERHPSFLVAEAYISPLHALEPLQGSLDH
jgi:hypothetical protein